MRRLANASISNWLSSDRLPAVLGAAPIMYSPRLTSSTSQTTGSPGTSVLPASQHQWEHHEAQLCLLTYNCPFVKQARAVRVV